MNPQEFRKVGAILHGLRAQVFAIADGLDDVLAGLDELTAMLHQARRTPERDGPKPFVTCDDFDIRRN